MKALTIGSRGFLFPVSLAFGNHANQAKLVDVPKPVPKESELLVKVEWFSANPTDVLHLDYIGTVGSTIGCDFVGTVEQIGGASSPSDRIKTGDRIVGIVHGGKYKGYGSAAEYLVVEKELCWGVPSGMEPSEAVTFGVGFVTAAFALYKDQGVSQSENAISGDKWFLVSGGATSVGMFMIQLARRAGYHVIATSSPKSFDLVRSFGADQVVSYQDHPAALSEIARLTNGGVVAGLDCVGGQKNIDFAIKAFGPSGGKITSLLPGSKSKRADVRLSGILLYTVLGKLKGQAFTFIPIVARYPAKPDDRAWYVQFCANAKNFIEKNGIKGNPTTIQTGGLAGIPASWDALREKKVSGTKLVHRI